MAADDEGMRGTVDKVAPWTLKAISTDVRNAAFAAAREEGVTVAQWVERVIRERIEAGGAPVNMMSGTSQPAAPAINPADVAAMMTATIAMATAAGVPVPPGLAHATFATTRKVLAAARGVRPRLSGPPKNGPGTE